MLYYLMYPVKYFEIEMLVSCAMFHDLVDQISQLYEIKKIKCDFIEKYYYIDNFGDKHFIGYRKEF